MAKTRLITRSANQHVPFKYCSRDVDRHGNERFYLRLPNMPKYRMTSAYLDEAGSVTQAFTEEYHRVLSGDRGEKRSRFQGWSPARFAGLSRPIIGPRRFKASLRPRRKTRRAFSIAIAAMWANCRSRRFANPISKPAR